MHINEFYIFYQIVNATPFKLVLQKKIIVQFY